MQTVETAHKDNTCSFLLIQNTRIVGQALVSNTVATWNPLFVEEQLRYSFELEFPEPDTEYSLHVGDLDPETAPEAWGQQLSTAIGIPRGRIIMWDSAVHFEGARGRVWLRLMSRSIAHSVNEQDRHRNVLNTNGWQVRARLQVYVILGKLSEMRYETMSDELRRLAAGLLFDLVAKSSRAVVFGVEPTSVSPVSSQIELRVLERLWDSLAPILQKIGECPALRLGTVNEYRLSYGSERLGLTSLARLAAVGFDPRERSVVRPFYAWRERYFEDHRTSEHAVIKGLLELVQGRVTDCVRNVEKHIAALEQDRPLRQLVRAGALSLYDSQDVPRLKELHEAMRRGETLHRQIRQALGLPFLAGVQARFVLQETPTFRHVQPYYRFLEIMRRYLRSSMLVLDDGDEERLKSTSRMYEQWAFFHLAGALRASGLKCVSREGLLHQTRGYRYTLDIDRGARLSFSASDGSLVVLRYEPWILPRIMARQRGNTLYREGNGAAWSPDMLVEVFVADGGGTPDEVPHVVILDAKYSTLIQDHHWASTSKYLNIRDTVFDRQVARQLWLISPALNEADPGCEINLRDPALKWTDRGPNVHPDEYICGWISLVPDQRISSSSIQSGWVVEPADVMVRFVQGLLEFLKVRQ